MDEDDKKLSKGNWRETILASRPKCKALNAEQNLKKRIYSFIAGPNSLPTPSSVLNAEKKPVE